MIIYLHALSYAGVGWEYRTSMPAWAAGDAPGEAAADVGLGSRVDAADG